MRGGTRDKRTRFLTSAHELNHLALDCEKSHQRQSWSARKIASIWTFDTKAEAEYRYQRYAASLCSQPVPATQSKPLLRQSRSQPPLVPEYKCFLKQAPSNADFRQLDLHKGKSGSGSAFAVYHSKQEFVDKAISAGHPFLEARPIDDGLKRNAFFILTEGLSSVAKFRITSIQKLSQMKQELSAEERRYQATLPLQAQQVLKGKSILLWRKLLDDSGFPDQGVKELIEGVALVGRPTKSELYGWKEVTTSVEDLLASSPWRNVEVTSKDNPAVSSASVQALWDITVSEVAKGFLEGPFDDLESVQKRLGVPSICVSRRFLLEQESTLSRLGPFNKLGPFSFGASTLTFVIHIYIYIYLYIYTYTYAHVRARKNKHLGKNQTEQHALGNIKSKNMHACGLKKTPCCCKLGTDRCLNLIMGRAGP